MEVFGTQKLLALEQELRGSSRAASLCLHAALDGVSTSATNVQPPERQYGYESEDFSRSQVVVCGAWLIVTQFVRVNDHVVRTCGKFIFSLWL